MKLIIDNCAMKFGNISSRNNFSSDLANVSINKHSNKIIEAHAYLHDKGTSKVLNQIDKITVLKRHIRNALNMISLDITNLFIAPSSIDLF